MAKKQTNGYPWTYCSLGGVVRVNITSGEDIAHLGELDQKLWTVLSCPTKDLTFDERTLKLIDTDGDGRVRASEIVAAAQWLTAVVKDKDAIMKGESVLKLDGINTECEAGRKLYKSAKQILQNLGLEKDEISVDDAADSVAIFKNTQFNGDGVITPASTDDEALKAQIAAIAEKIGSATDRSGEAGVTAEQIEAFYAALADYAAWQDAGEADKKDIFPYGDNTAAALAACEAVQDKVADYFMRCKLIRFDDAVSAAVDVSAERVGAISEKNLATQAEEIATYPLARPAKEAVLPFDAINPAWQAPFAAVKALVLDVDFPKAKSITEEEWNGVLARFGAYKSWMAAKKGEAVEALGLDEVKALLKADRKADLLALVEADVALKDESESIDEVKRLMLYYRDFAKLLRNYVIFTDFYGREQGTRGIFEIGKLYIDERCCDLCIKVSDMGAHGDMPKLSGMFLLYCKCTSKARGETMDVVAVMTDGNTRDLRPGKNGLFYDLDGNDWDAVITKVVENPISVKDAFWAPYRKVARFVSDKIDKSAADKDADALAKLTATTEKPAGEAVKQPFDIAKFAGIAAAVGMALAGIGAVLVALGAAVKSLVWWQWLIIIAAVMLIISGPSCFIAWRKLRKRNLGPVLNANGWAVNSMVLVNILFGKTLTSVAKYPKLKLEDPYAKKTPWWRKCLRWLVCLLIFAFGVLYFTDNLQWMGIERKAKTEQVEEAPEAPAEAPAEEPAAETAE
ncbi:MAG: phage holin family protein [Bacteroidales bacterium]|nr:phage holin family protein [Bacteroidales bacterium]